VRRLVEFPLEGGGVLAVEVDEPDVGGTTRRIGRADETADHAVQTFETAIDRIKPAAAAIVTKLAELKDSPDQISVEFGFNLNAKLGAVIASANVAANFKVALLWKRESAG